MKYSRRRISRMMSDDLTKKIESFDEEQVIYGAVKSKEMDLFSLLDTEEVKVEETKSDMSFGVIVLLFFMFIMIVGVAILIYSLLRG